MANKRNGTMTAPLTRGRPGTVDEMVRTVNEYIGVTPEPRWELMALDLHGQRARELEIIKLLGEIAECLKSSQ